jgi:UDP-glucose 4-epimerase
VKSRVGSRRERVLVTGAAGFIGSHVVDQCLALGLDVVATDDLSGGRVENVPEGCRFVRGDLRDPVFVSSLWSEGGYHTVYHLAAYAAEGLSHFIRRFNYDTNLLASINLINESLNSGVSCFVFTSSIAVYGKNQVPMREDMVPQPEDPYGVSKYAIELDLRSAFDMFGMDYVIFRPHNVYGERQNCADTYRNVVGIFMNQVLQGKPMTVFGDGTQTRAFSHIDDVAPLIAVAPYVDAARNEVFNVGADTPYSVLSLADSVARSLGVEPRIEHLPARNEVLHAFADHRKSRSVFEPAPPVPLDVGLQRMAEWVRRNGPAEPVMFDGVEVERNLPPSWARTLRQSARV